VGVEEYGYVAPDPLNPDIVYGGKVTRFDRRTGQTQQVGPNGGGRGGRGGENLFRAVRTAPILFSPTNPRKLYYGTNVVWETVNGGHNWKQISPDLSRETWTAPANVGKYAGSPATNPSRRGVVYTIAPSPVDSNTIWAGTDDGLIQVTRNGGKSWTNVTPPAIGPWAKVSIMDASHSDANVAYAAVNTLRLDDLNPHIYRTRDGGKTWTEIVSGIDRGASVNTVKEDPKRKGLLFAGSERTVWYSLDDGDHWRSLRINLPATSIRDLIIKDNDLAVGTHGRGFWILDDISVLRQWNEKTADAAVTLFKPATATRVRYSMYTDTPVPPDEPMSENPPDGAVIDYYLKNDVNGLITLEILGEKGRVIRKFSSTDPNEPAKDVMNWPHYWFRPAQVLSTKAGMQRYVWDLHFTPPGTTCSLPISATPRNTKCEPEGPWVHPGTYTARLTVNGTAYTQTFSVRMDPRVKTSSAALLQQYTLSLALYDATFESTARATQLRAVRAELAKRKSTAPADVVKMIDALDGKIVALTGPEAGTSGRGGGGGGGRGGGAGATDSFGGMSGQFLAPLNTLQDADEPATTQLLAAVNERLKAFGDLKSKWDALVKTDVAAINAKLKAAGAEPLKIAKLVLPNRTGVKGDDGEADWP